MATRTITGTIHHPGGDSPWAAATIKLTLMAFFGTSVTTYPGEVYEAVTDAAGQFSITVAVPTTGSAAYRVALPSGESFSVNLQAGAALTLEELVAIATDPAAAQNTLQTLIDSHAAQKATTSLSSHAELATDAEAIAKADTGRVITPSNLAALDSSETFKGLIERATVPEAQAGTDNERAVTPAGLPLFKPNGTALQAVLTGNARGNFAIDLQLLRITDDDVPSGDYAVVLGVENDVSGFQSMALGANNKITGMLCQALGSENDIDPGVSLNGLSLAVGVQNIIDADEAFALGSGNQISKDRVLAMGRANVITGDDSHAIGETNTVSGASSSAFGFSNTVSGSHAMALGYFSVANKYGQKSFASGRFAANGDAQTSTFVARKSVAHVNANWFELFLNGSSQRMTIAADTVWTFTVLVVGTTQGCTKSFGFKIEGIIENDGGTVTLLVSTITTLYDTDDVSFDARARGDDTNKALVIEVQDADGAGGTVRWVASVQTVEVTFPA